MATTSVSIAGCCASISSAIVPWPAITARSSNGWTTVRPRSSARASGRRRARPRRCRLRARPRRRSRACSRPSPLEAKRGITIVAAMPIRSAWYATACAWLPAETASTPLARSAAVSCAILLSAPRSLNEAVNCRFSNFEEDLAAADRRERARRQARRSLDSRRLRRARGRRQASRMSSIVAHAAGGRALHQSRLVRSLFPALRAGSADPHRPSACWCRPGSPSARRR